MVRFSREILERILRHSTVLNDLLEVERGSPYNAGDYSDSVETRDKDIKKNCRTRLAIAQVCRWWHLIGLKYFVEFLIVDSKCAESWEHVNETLKIFALGPHVKRLEFDAFDSSNLRIKNVVKILNQCPNVRYLMLTFPDDSRKSSSIGDLLLYITRQVSASKVVHLSCNFGDSFDQASVLQNLADFPNLRTLQFHSAFGLEPVCECDPVYMRNLCSLKLTTTKDKSLHYMSSWPLPSFQDLSIFQLYPIKAGDRRFFSIHGYKIRTLELTYLVEGVSDLLNHCVNLEELVLSLDGMAYQGGINYRLFHKNVKRIGIRDVCINEITVRKTMGLLKRLMQKLTTTKLFQNVWEIRLLDFQRALFVNIGWYEHHATLWKEWVQRCEDMLIVLYFKQRMGSDYPSYLV